MSLTEWVNAAGRGDARESPRGSALAELKRRVRDILPSDQVASMMAVNPKQAENELRIACMRVFEESPWLAQGDQARAELARALLDGVFGLGPLEALLADPQVTEIMVNGCKSLYVERHGKLEELKPPFTEDEQVRTLIDRIIGPLGRRIDESSPMVNARLSQGHRVNAVIPPLSLDGPVLTVRKFREHVILLEEMVESGSMDVRMAQFLTWAVRAKRNITVSGGTGSGKTTLLNALSCKIGHAERIITIEDSAELRFHEHPHVVRLEARPKNSEGIGEVCIRDLVINSLRMRPDRIVVGECRGAEALDMLQAMNTGHDGSLTTLHANSPSDAVLRLGTMVRYASDLPVDVIDAQIGSALDCIVQTARAADGRRYVSQVDQVAFDGQARRARMDTLFRWDRGEGEGEWLKAPSWIGMLPAMGVAKESEVGEWMHRISLG